MSRPREQFQHGDLEGALHVDRGERVQLVARDFQDARHFELDRTTVSRLR
ncbi:MAG: hypothetical protein KDB80_11385 [Planctomycetes bacterium]|nr:hypothetical protein [Planctomycetota bacterium]